MNWQKPQREKLNFGDKIIEVSNQSELAKCSAKWHFQTLNYLLVFNVISTIIVRASKKN